MKKILITGATGFVGANLVRKLIATNKYDVHILTRETSNLWRIKDIYKQVTDWKVDLENEILLEKIVNKIKPEYIVHMAIYGGRPKENDEKKIIGCNLYGTINLVNACKNIDYKLFINTGSSSEYGQKNHPMNENDRCDPINLYGIGKLGATLYCNKIAQEQNKNIGTVRLFSPFGDYEDKGRLFPDVILGALDNKEILLGNPNAVRDFIYIEDTIDFYMNIIENNKIIKGEIYNCAFGEQHSVREVAEKIVFYLGSESKLNFGANSGRVSDTEIWCGNIGKAKKDLEWEPKLNFDESIQKACEWYKRNKDKYEEIR